VIDSDGIEAQRGHRRTPDITVSNHLDTRATFEITVDGQSADHSPVYDVVELPADGFESYSDVFSLGDEYDVTVAADGMTASTSHLSTRTNTVPIALEEGELAVTAAER